MEIDQSELAGYSFSCLEGCAMCCLCQPELSLRELERFRGRGLAAGLTKQHIQGYSTDKPTAIKLQGGAGACHFLRDRKCTAYGLRPAFCRQFPVHFHALHRIQLNANLSCRGIVRGGTSLAEFGNAALADADPQAIAGAMAEASNSLAAYRKESGDAYRTPDELRAYGYAALRGLRSPGGIGQLLSWADSNREIPRPGEMAGAMESSTQPDDLEETAMLGNLDQLQLENPAWRPVFVDEKFRWLTYHAASDNIVVQELAERGGTRPLMEIPAGDVRLLAPEPGALAVFGEYSSLLNSRDPFLGYAYWLSREEGFANDPVKVYLGAMATAMLDLWWRSCLAGRIIGRTKLDEGLAREGVRAFDMDCLDMPTIGIFF